MTETRTTTSAIEEKYEEVKHLIAIGKEKGYLLYDEVNENLPSEVSSSDELDELFEAFGAMPASTSWTRKRSTR